MRILCFLIVLLFIACSSKLKVVEIRNEAGKLIEKYTQNVETQQREGESELYASDGKLLEKSYYKNGQLHGERILYHENEKIQVIERYDNGEFKGLYQAYYDNGQLEIEGKYIDGQMNGKWKRYYTSGELMEIVTFVSNYENGPFVEYHKNGKIKTEGKYLDGDNEQGELKMYDEEGMLIRKMDCNKGICKTIWTAEKS